MRPKAGMRSFEETKITTKASHHCCSILDARSMRNTREIWGCSSAGRAPALQAGGQGFESLHLHQKNGKRDGLIAQVVRARA